MIAKMYWKSDLEVLIHGPGYSSALPKPQMFYQFSWLLTANTSLSLDKIHSLCITQHEVQPLVMTVEQNVGVPVIFCHTNRHANEYFYIIKRVTDLISLAYVSVSNTLI
jgi:hypothetical protein